MLRIKGIIWLDEIIDKLLWKHSVNCEEVIQTLKNDAYFRFVEKGHKPNENVYAALGKTDNGRYLTVFFILKKDGNALIISARDMSKKEKKLYGKK